jgi:nucleoside-diphosphate-sugar epimerase
VQNFANTADLENELSRPTPGVLDTLRSLDGDVIVLGAGGKMGPTLARMLRRGMDSLGQNERRVVAVSRFTSGSAASGLQQHGVETIACDLMDREAVMALPDAPNVIYMAGQKFGTSETPELTWMMNTMVPAMVAEKYSKSRIVVFSTGCVYSLVPAASKGACEDAPLEPPGEYANSCVGRERVFTHFAKRNRTRALLFRLCYAIDLRYGVLCDVATKVATGEAIDVSMGAVNVIWQGDANARAIQCLAHTASPPLALNVTGIERVSIRWLAHRFGKYFAREPVLTGVEGPKAWLWDASRSYDLFGPPSVSLDEMIEATADWVLRGGEQLGKPTHFETTDGRF